MPTMTKENWPLYVGHLLPYRLKIKKKTLKNLLKPLILRPTTQVSGIGVLDLLFMNDLITVRFKLVHQLPHSLKVLKRKMC